MPNKSSDILVIDTEGAPILREVAVVDGHGELLLEAQTSGHGDSYHSSDQQIRSLRIGALRLGTASPTREVVRSWC